MSIEFRCSAFTTPMVDAKDLLTRILSVHNLILKKLNYEVSLSVSPSEAFGVLFLHMAVSDIPKKDESPEKVIESYNLRKSPNSLTQRSITNVSKKIISSVEEKVGVENSFFFLKSAVKVLHKKRNWDIELESDNGVEEDNDAEDDSFENRIIQGEAVQSAVKSLPKKNVSFTKKDKGVVMKLFDVVKKEVEMRVTSKSEIIAMSITKNILSEIPYYRPIKKKDIRRWCCRRLRKIQKSGKKINEEFEAQIWGNLLLCVFEDRNEANSEQVYFNIYSSLPT